MAYAYGHFFHQTRNGTFLEVGAQDGAAASATAPLVDLGWYGVVVDGSVANFQQLAVNRPHDVAVNVAVCDVARLVHYAVDGSPKTHGVAEYMPPAYFKRYHRRIKFDGMVGQPVVPCVPLSFIASTLGIGHVDLFVLDVQCGHVPVLRSINWTALTFDVLAVVGAGSDSDEVTRLVTSHGYTVAGKSTALWFTAPAFRPSAVVV